MKRRLLRVRAYFLIGCLTGVCLINMTAIAADRVVTPPKANATSRPTGLSTRVALVIGNATYPNPKDALPFAINDANDMAQTLSHLGFDVTVATDVNLRKV